MLVPHVPARSIVIVHTCTLYTNTGELAPIFSTYIHAPIFHIKIHTLCKVTLSNKLLCRVCI